MLRIRDCKIVLIAALVLVNFRVPLARAQVASDKVEITAVVAVEEARSPYGPFRVVFELGAPLPAATDGRGEPEFFLGPEHLRIPPGNEVGTQIIAYCDRVPPKQTTLRAAWPLAGPDGRGPIASEMPCDPADLLRHSRPARGQYEAPHIRRAAGPVDLLRSWTDADVAAVATFIRFDVDPDDKDVRERHFRIDEILHGDKLQDGATVVLRPSAGLDYELGARYLLFLHRTAGGDGVDPTRYVAVRVWWAINDPVLSWVQATAPRLDELDGRDRAAAEKACGVFASALNSPAAPVRYTAAARLTSLVSRGTDLSATQRNLILARLAGEPDAAVKAALRELSERANK
jgi:hypothetical protein